MNKRQILVVILHAFLVVFGSALYAEDTGSVTRSEMDPDQIKKKASVTAFVSATRREMPVEDATRFVTLITRRQIEESGKAYVLDLLRSAPGVTVNQSGPRGRTASVFTRGTNANHTLVMLDGVQISSPTAGQPNLEHLSTSGIERIEILRGSQSVLYGSDALGGVINIVTKPKTEKGIAAKGQFEFGTYETFSESGGLEGNLDRISFSGSGSRVDTDGPGENDGYQNTTARGRARLQVTENSFLDSTFHYYNAQTGIEDGAALQDPNRRLKSREQVLSSRYTADLTDFWRQHVQYSFFHDAFSDFDPRNPGGTGSDPEAVPFKLDTDRHTLEYQSEIQILDADVLTAGYEFEHTSSNIKRSAGFDELVRNHGWYANNELNIMDIWSLVTGVRLDGNSLYGTEVNPQISTAVRAPKTQTVLKGSFGRAFKGPTFNELAFPGFGNPDLKPETSWSWDAGLEQQYWDGRGEISVSYFYSSVENLIQFTGSPLRAENVARATIQGIELSHEIAPVAYVTVYTTYTYLDTQDDDTGKRLVRRPKHQGKLGVTVDYKKLHAQSDWLWVGDRLERGGLHAKAYTRLDFIAAYDVTGNLQIYGRVENATGDHYQEVIGFNAPSTQFFAGMKLTASHEPKN